MLISLMIAASLIVPGTLDCREDQWKDTDLCQHATSGHNDKPKFIGMQPTSSQCTCEHPCESFRGDMKGVYPNCVQTDNGFKSVEIEGFATQPALGPQEPIRPKFPAYRCEKEYPKATHCDKDSSFCLSDSFDTDDLPLICRPVEE